MAWEDEPKARYDVDSLQEEFRERLYNSPPAIDESQVNSRSSRTKASTGLSPKSILPPGRPKSS